MLRKLGKGNKIKSSDEENSLFDRARIKEKKKNRIRIFANWRMARRKMQELYFEAQILLASASSDRSALFFLLAYVPGSYSSYDVEKYHFIRAPCAAIKHVYEAYRNFMKSGIESVWAHNDENNKDAVSRNLSIGILWTYISCIEIRISITIFHDTFLTLNKNSFLNFWEILPEETFDRASETKVKNNIYE